MKQFFLKSVLIFSCIIIPQTLWSNPVDVQGDFPSVQPNGLPAGWSIHTWEGYEPFPEVRIVPGPDGKSALSMTKVLGPDGGAIQTSQRFPTRSGDTGRVTFRVRGKGQAWVTFYRWGEQGGWNGVIPGGRFQLADTWQPQAITIPVDNGHAFQTRFVTLAIGAQGGSELELADLKLDIENQEITGDRRLPNRWTVYAPMRSDFSPRREELTSVPDTLGSVSGRQTGLRGAAVDFARLEPQPGETLANACCWVYSSMDSPYDCEYTIAVDTPHSLAVYLNGEMIATGQTKGGGPASDPAPFNLPLKKGTNVLAFRLEQAETSSALLNLWGPKELRGTTKRLTMVQTTALENFDGATAACSGAPTLINGNPTPGLLTQTGQGVFKTGLTAQTTDGIDITIPNSRILLKSGPLPQAAPGGNATAKPANTANETANETAAKSGNGSNDNLFPAAGLRIQNFGSDERRKPGALEIVCVRSASNGQTSNQREANNGASRSDNQRAALCRIDQKPDSDQLTVSVVNFEGNRVKSFSVPYRMLPADFFFGVSDNDDWTVYVNSLADSQSIYRSGTLCLPPAMGTLATDSLVTERSELSTGQDDGAVDFRFRFSKTSAEAAEITVDNLTVGLAVSETKSASAPFKIDLLPSFDPLQAGWKKVFDDEFDGTKVDMDKWYYSSSTDKERASVHDGLLEISCDWNQQKTKVTSASLYSNELFGYGYYEARVKFRQQSGWWSAFWLCTHGPSNPFTDGWEIDIYEDYYMGPKNPGESPRGVLDHNLHVFGCGTLRSWNYNSKLPGSVDDFYVVGCKWTPFEVSYYLNGRQIRSEAGHSPYDSVTFDPFHHAAGFVPLHAILSGCCGKSGGDPNKGTFPESFFVDYVRIYEYPNEAPPTVQLTKRPSDDEYILRPGDAIQFEATVQPSSRTNAPIKTVYLFDSGALLDYKTQPPYSFDVPITKEYYDKTDFVKPGRTGIRPDFDRGQHAFCVFAQDEQGNVGRSETIVKMLRKEGKTRPWQGKPHAIPGTIGLMYYDEGGQGVAYSDSTPENAFSQTFRPGESVDATPTVIGSVNAGEWLKYTIAVQEPGAYTFKFKYGTPTKNQKGPKLMIDRKTAGEFQTPAHEYDDWRSDSIAELTGVQLTAGEHELVLFFQGGYNIESLTVEKTRN